MIRPLSEKNYNRYLINKENVYCQYLNLRVVVFPINECFLRDAQILRVEYDVVVVLLYHEIDGNLTCKV